MNVRRASFLPFQSASPQAWESWTIKVHLVNSCPIGTQLTDRKQLSSYRYSALLINDYDYCIFILAINVFFQIAYCKNTSIISIVFLNTLSIVIIQYLQRRQVSVYALRYWNLQRQSIGRSASCRQYPRRTSWTPYSTASFLTFIRFTFGYALTIRWSLLNAFCHPARFSFLYSRLQLSQIEHSFGNAASSGSGAGGATGLSTRLRGIFGWCFIGSFIRAWLLGQGT